MSSEKNGKTRKIIGTVLMILVLIFAAYLTGVMLYRTSAIVLTKAYMKVFRYEMMICAVWLICALDIRFGFFTRIPAKAAKALGWLLRIVIGGAGAALLCFTCFVAFKGFGNDSADTKNAIVLGMALENGKPNQDLLNRVRRAEEYLQAHPDSTLICTGGNKTETSPSEAEIMKELLMQDGVAEERIVLEDQANDTAANFRNTAKIIDPSEPVTVITNSYHMYRSAEIAAEAGFTQIQRGPAHSDPVFYGANLLWEIVSIGDRRMRALSKKTPAESSAAQ